MSTHSCDFDAILADAENVLDEEIPVLHRHQSDLSRLIEEAEDIAGESVNSFSVDEWRAADDRLTIVLIDLSGSTSGNLQGGTTILQYAKDYVMCLAPAICRGRCVVIGCSSRCMKQGCRGKVFCNCEQSDCTRVLLRTEGACPPAVLRDAVRDLKPEGATFVAKPIASLTQVALAECELTQRQRAQEQRVAWYMGCHPRLGAHSPIRRLPREVVEVIAQHIGPALTHARVIMAIDGDNNVGCGELSCRHCLEADLRQGYLEGGQLAAASCPLNGPEGVTRAVRRLLAGADGLKLNVEVNVAMVGNGRADRQQLQALCAATGGRYDSVEHSDREFMVDSLRFFDKTALDQRQHVGSRRRAVAAYTQMVRDGTVPDVGVATLFRATDQEIVNELDEAELRRRATDEERQALCERTHGVACMHGQDRDACLLDIRRALTS